MDRTRKIRLISNSFYNAGLERAKRRDLTGAVEYLKKCLNLTRSGRRLCMTVSY